MNPMIFVLVSVFFSGVAVASAVWATVFVYMARKYEK